MPHSFSIMLTKEMRSVNDSFRLLFNKHEQILNITDLDMRILMLTSRFASLLTLIARGIERPWAIRMAKDGSCIVDDTLVSYNKLSVRFKNEESAKDCLLMIDPNAKASPRMALCQKLGYKDALKAHKAFSRSSRSYTTLSKDVSEFERATQRRDIGEKIYCVIQALMGLVHEVPMDRQMKLINTIVNDTANPAFICPASSYYIDQIVIQMQSAHFLLDTAIEELKRNHFYIFYYTNGSLDFQGFFILDQQVHYRTTEPKQINILHCETKKEHRKRNIAKRMLQWIKDTARQNGYSSLCATPAQPNDVFWERCGFTVRAVSFFQSVAEVNVTFPCNRAMKAGNVALNTPSS